MIKPVTATDDFEQKIIHNVANHGCHINYIFDPEGYEPNFSYSIGFEETIDQPEVIVFGLSQTLMHSMINITLGKCVNGLHLYDGAEIDGLLEGHRCFARAVLPEEIVCERFNSAMWYHRQRTGELLTRAVQIVWPGAVDGLFPWDDGCGDMVRELQPALYRTELNS